MLLKEAGNLPVAIVRPSIGRSPRPSVRSFSLKITKFVFAPVVACLEEPTPGWLDNWNGPTGIVSAVGNGVFRTIICESNYVVDVVPVDIVINLMIVTAWRTASTDNASTDMKVYNCVTSKQNPVTWKEFVGLSLQNMIKHPLEGVFWFPTAKLSMNRPMNMVVSYLAHYIPAYFIDLCAWSMGKRPM